MSPRKDKSFFDNYPISVELEGELEKNLKSVSMSNTAWPLLHAMQHGGAAGPEIEDSIKANFGLHPDLHYRFVEKLVHERRICLLFGYDRQAVQDIKWVTFDETALLHFAPLPDSSSSQGQLNHLDLQLHQEGVAVPTRINGHEKIILFIRDRESGSVERITMSVPVIQRACRSLHRNIVAAAQGYLARKALMKASQENTPYPDYATFLFANHNLRSMFFDRPESIQPQEKFSKDRKTRVAQWEVYRSARGVRLLDSPVAYLYSFRKKGDFFSEVAARGAPNSTNKAQKIPGIGHIYRPKPHSMPVNFAWMQGLAHHGIQLVLTTSLDEQILVRRKAPQDGKAIEKHASALLREIVGLLQDGKYAVTDGERGKKIFSPTVGARTATLQSFQNSRQKVRQQVEDLLSTHGLSIEAVSEDSAKVSPAFDKEAFLGRLLASDLDNASGDFPFLATCQYAGIELTPTEFNSMLSILGDPHRHDVHERAVHMLSRMVDGLMSEPNTKLCLPIAVQAFDLIGNLELKKNLVDGIHNKAASRLSLAERADFLRLFAVYFARAAIASLPDNSHVHLLEHIVRSRAMVRDYAWLPANIMAEPDYSEIPLMDALSSELCFNPLLAEQPAVEATLALIERLLAATSSDRANWVLGVAGRLPLWQNYQRDYMLWSLLLNERGRMTDTVQRQSLDDELGRIVVLREAVRPDFSVMNTINRLAAMGIGGGDWLPVKTLPALRGLAPAAQRHCIDTVLVYMNNLSVDNSARKLVALMSLASAAEIVDDRLLLPYLLNRLKEERAELAMDAWQPVADRLRLSLIARPWQRPQIVIDRLEAFGISIDPFVFRLAIRRLLAPSNVEPDAIGAAHLALALAHRISLNAEQKFQAFQELASCLGKKEFQPASIELISGMLTSIAAAEFDSRQEADLERDIADFLEKSFASLVNVQLALPAAQTWIVARPDIFLDYRPNLARVRSLLAARAALFAPTGDRWSDLLRVSESLQYFPENERSEAVRQIRLQFERDAAGNIQENENSCIAILASVIDCVCLELPEKQQPLMDLIRCIDAGLNRLGGSGITSMLEHIGMQLSTPPIAQNPGAYAAMLHVFEQRLSIVHDRGQRRQLLDQLFQIANTTDLLSADLRAATLISIAKHTHVSPNGKTVDALNYELQELLTGSAR